MLVFDFQPVVFEHCPVETVLKKKCYASSLKYCSFTPCIYSLTGIVYFDMFLLQNVITHSASRVLTQNSVIKKKDKSDQTIPFIDRKYKNNRKTLTNVIVTRNKRDELRSELTFCCIYSVACRCVSGLLYQQNLFLTAVGRHDKRLLP